MLKPQRIAMVIAGLITVVALGVVAVRGGLIGWGALFVGAALLAKIWFKPSAIDLGLCVGFTILPVLMWVVTFYYVISTWESGEVVDLAIDTSDGPHTVRVWVLDIGVNPLVYYDAEPQAAKSLLAGKPVQFTRAGQVSTRIPKATQVDALSGDEADLIFQAMGAKYGDRVDAADIYYLMLGRARDRVALVAELSMP